MEVKKASDKSRLTARQWAKQGYVQNPDASGIEMWTNRYCGQKAVYLTQQEVHKGTKEELKAFWHPEKQRNAQRKKELEAQKKELEAARQAEIKEYIQMLERRVAILKKVAGQLAKQSLQPLTETHETIVIDIETTGLDCCEDEILQVSIISDSGKTLYDSYIKPIFTESWKDAERIHHITPEMVADAPTIYEEMPKINAILRNAKRIIGYNHSEFDNPFLKQCGAVFPEDAEIYDVMLEFAPIYGEWNDHYANYKWQKLATCADYYGYDWGCDIAHNSLSDCRATLYCYNKIRVVNEAV